MRYLALLLFFPLSVMADDWTREDTARELTYLALHVVDWGQTRNISKNPDRFYEINPILGEHPSIKRVDSYMTFSILVHVGVAYILPREWRTAFQYASLGEKVGFVIHNNRIGIRIDF